jgi:hypothetical protein
MDGLAERMESREEWNTSFPGLLHSIVYPTQIRSYLIEHVLLFRQQSTDMSIIVSTESSLASDYRLLRSFFPGNFSTRHTFCS